MGTVSISLPSDGSTADVSDYNTPLSTLVTEINGNLDNANIKAGAAIATSKLADDAGITAAKIASGAVTNAKLSTTAGELGGAWQSWTPTWTNLTIGTSTVDGKYTQIGKTVHFRLAVTLNGATVGSNPTFSLPVTAVAYPSTMPVGTANLSTKNGWISLPSTTTGIPRVWDANNDTGSVTASLPVVWANGSVMYFTGTYEAA